MAACGHGASRTATLRSASMACSFGFRRWIFEIAQRYQLGYHVIENGSVDPECLGYFILRTDLAPHDQFKQFAQHLKKAPYAVDRKA